MRVETTENGEIQILSCLEKADAGRIRRTPDRLIAASDAALENATYVDRVFDTFQDVPAAFESYRCGQIFRAYASLGRMCHRRAHLPTACGRGDQFVIQKGLVGFSGERSLPMQWTFSTGSDEEAQEQADLRKRMVKSYKGELSLEVKIVKSE